MRVWGVEDRVRGNFFFRAGPDLFMKELRVRILRVVSEHESSKFASQVVKILPALWRV